MNIRQLRVLCGMVVLSVMVAGLSGCGRSDAASYIASARTYIEKADYKAAIIQIKNALQKEPDNGEARSLLAKSLLETGDPAGAEAEVRKAMALHRPDDETVPLLAHALAGQGEFKKLTTELGARKLDNPTVRADLSVMLATGYLAQGDRENGKALLAGAIADEPNDPRALLLRAQLEAQGGDMEAVRKSVDLALHAAPDDVEALLMKTEIALADGKPDDARKLLEHAIDKHPDSIAARFAMISLALKSGKLDAAKTTLAKMKEVAPRDFRTVYSDALVSFAAGDTVAARDAIQRVLAGRPDHLPSELLSGLISLQLGSYSAAEESLRKVLARVPDDPSTRRALALVYLRTGRAPQALEMLGPALQRSPDDPVMLRTAGEAYLASGNTAAAARSYERANTIDKNNIGSEVRLAQVRLAAGDTARAFSDLDALSASDSSKYQAELALFTAHMRRREYDEALAAVDTLEKKQPKSALPFNLRGIVYLAKRDLKNARASFEKALEIQPNYYAAANSLAVLDIQEGKPQAARERYDRLLAKDSKNEQLLLASAQLLTITGGTPEQIQSAVDKAVAANPASVPARLARIGFSVRQRDPKGAVSAAQAALGAIPNNPQLTEALGVSELASGDINQAIDTFKRLVQLQPQNPLVLLRLAEAQVAVKDYAAAIESERKALVLKPELGQTLSALAKTYLISGQPDAAIAEARKLQKDKPDKAFGFVLEGEILLAQKKTSESAQAFREALSREPSPLAAARLYVALASAGKDSDATAVGAKWMQDHPKDPTIPLLLAQQSQQRKDLSGAAAGYQKVLEIEPDNVVALNNLAWILSEQKNPQGLEYAERAHRLAPFNPGVLDTLGWALVRSGDAKRGVQLLRMASSLAPMQGDIRLHLAQALVDSGDKAGARKELTELSTKLDKASPIRAEAEKLLATL